MLDALSRALQLDATANSYLHALARLVSRPVQPITTPVVDRTRWLIDSWPMTAAMILDRHNDIVVSNSLMATLVNGYREGRNALAVLLLDPAVRELYVDWDGLSRRSIGLLRSRVGLDPDHARTQELIAELTQHSERFRELWHRHDIEGMTEGTHPMNHPVAGSLSLHYAQFPARRHDRSHDLRLLRRTGHSVRGGTRRSGRRQVAAVLATSRARAA